MLLCSRIAILVPHVRHLIPARIASILSASPRHGRELASPLLASLIKSAVASEELLLLCPRIAIPVPHGAPSHPSRSW